MDSFYIGAYWGSRAESLHEVVNKTLHTLKKLSTIDVQFESWYNTAISRKKALQQPINYNDESFEIDKIVSKSVRKGGGG